MQSKILPQAVAGIELVPAVVACIQTFGDRINLHPHAHLLVSEGGEDNDGRFHHIQKKAKSWFVTSASMPMLIGGRCESQRRLPTRW